MMQTVTGLNFGLHCHFVYRKITLQFASLCFTCYTSCWPSYSHKS